MFVVKTELELAFMTQVQLLGYIRAIASERMRLLLGTELDREAFAPFVRALEEASAHCDHTDGRGRSLMQEDQDLDGNPCVSCLVCKASTRTRALKPYWSNDAIFAATGGLPHVG